MNPQPEAWLADLTQLGEDEPFDAWLYGVFDDGTRPARVGLLAVNRSSVLFYRRRFVGQECRRNPIGHVIGAHHTAADAGPRSVMVELGDMTLWRLSRISHGDPDRFVAAVNRARGG